MSAYVYIERAKGHPWAEVLDFMDLQIISPFVEVTSMNDPCRKYIGGIPDGQSITFPMNWMTADEVRAHEWPTHCSYCGRRRRLDGLGQCVGCGAPE